MRKILLVLSIVLPAFSYSQSNSGFQIGPSFSFYKNSGKAYGGEISQNIALNSLLSIGPGVQVLKLENVESIYVPVFATFKISMPVNKTIFYYQINPGYGIYGNTVNTGTIRIKQKGGFYLMTGIGIHGVSKASPYLSF